MRIGVIGVSTMGGGLAQLFASAGHDAVLESYSDASVAKGLKGVKDSIGKALWKRQLCALQAAGALRRITPVVGLQALADAGVEQIYEASPEDDRKYDLLCELSELVGPEVLIFTVTSSMSINKLGERMRHPERFAGAHYFNPPPTNKLVEGIRGNRTSDKTMAAAESLARSLGKVYVELPDLPGFAGNYCGFSNIRAGIVRGVEISEALGIPLQEAFRRVDAAMEAGFSHPMGPIVLSDFVGNDVTKAILANQGMDVPSILAELVAQGKLGRKTKSGFYTA